MCKNYEYALYEIMNTFNGKAVPISAAISKISPNQLALFGAYLDRPVDLVIGNLIENGYLTEDPHNKATFKLSEIGYSKYDFFRNRVKLSEQNTTTSKQSLCPS